MLKAPSNLFAPTLPHTHNQFPVPPRLWIPPPRPGPGPSRHCIAAAAVGGYARLLHYGIHERTGAGHLVEVCVHVEAWVEGGERHTAAMPGTGTAHARTSRARPIPSARPARPAAAPWCGAPAMAALQPRLARCAVRGALTAGHAHALDAPAEPPHHPGPLHSTAPALLPGSIIGMLLPLLLPVLAVAHGPRALLSLLLLLPLPLLLLPLLLLHHLLSLSLSLSSLGSALALGLLRQGGSGPHAAVLV